LVEQVARAPRYGGWGTHSLSGNPGFCILLTTSRQYFEWEACVDDFIRRDPPSRGSERDLLIAFLEYHRSTLLLKVSGVRDGDLRRSIVPSGITLLGLVRHLSYAERFWFQYVFAGEDVEIPWLALDLERDADWRVGPDETATQVLALYRSAARRSRQIAAAASLDQVARRPVPYYRDASQSWQPMLRWILLHMIEELARHNGHADLLRESFDGVTGE
jgi:hypothetical protein